jgi:ribosomal protein S18 acetylase RimI-like enzyme
MNGYEIVDTQADNIRACGFCGYKSGRNEGHRRKSEWLKKRYAEGLKFKVLRSEETGDVGMIEYVPGRYAWRPVKAEGYLFIHCLMISGRHKGKGLGARLLDSCLKDAKRNRCRGVATVTSSGSFMAGSGLFVKAGFVVVESRPPYELLVRKFRKGAPDPHFSVNPERILKRYKKGLTLLAADQCPMVPKWVEEIAEASLTLGLKPKVVRLRSAEASRELPTPYGMFCIIHNGELIAERPVSARRFTNILRRRI